MPLPQFSFFITGYNNEVSTDSDLWKLSLLDRDYPGVKAVPRKETCVSTVGQYLKGCEQFLKSDHYGLLLKALRCLSGKDIRISQVHSLKLHLEKHGAYYHPVRVAVRIDGGGQYFLVLNGAVSAPGRRLVSKEFELLSVLGDKRAPCLPRMFGTGTVDIDGVPIAFLFGEWLSGFNEFHLTDDNQRRQVVIWADDGSPNYVEQDVFFPVYGSISQILSYCYDVSGFRQIWPWHHAAGDFVVKKMADGYDVRLITVRGYDNLTEFESRSPDNKRFMWPALLCFFLNLTLRLRLDRLNGTGPPALVDEKVLPFIIDGFIKGLAQNQNLKDDSELRFRFLEFASTFAEGQLREMMRIQLETHPPASFERTLIEQNLKDHVENLRSIMQST